MIRKLYSNLPKFKNLEFHQGLNILLAEKSPGATDRQTRNRAGKSSIVEIIHFLSGSSADSNSLFAKEALSASTFGMEWDLTGHTIQTERSGKKRNRVFIIKGDTTNWPYTPEIERNDNKPSLPNNQWRFILGQLMFKLTLDTQAEPWGPKFRSLFSYFVRREYEGAFMYPVKHSVQQQKGDQQVALMFITGLDWTIPQQLQRTRDRERMLRELRRATAEGSLGEVIGTTAQLRTNLTVAEDKVQKLSEQLASFHVLPQYEQYEGEASILTRQIASLNNENTMDRELLGQLESAIGSENPPVLSDVDRVFREAGIILPDSVKHRFEDVRKFHESVIENRKMYLETEIQGVRERIASREQEKQNFDNRRAQLMAILSTHGALEHFSSLQGELTRLRAEAEKLRQQYETAELLASQKTELEAERNRLYQRLRQDFSEQKDTVKMAILAFEHVSSRLYEEAGKLTPNETLDGPEFEVAIQGARSTGISKMQVFCFDMMLMQLCSERQIGPGFLVHDSHLFDGVDERQVANALHQGALLAKQLSFQYIVTMNSDDLPPAAIFPKDFNIEDYLLPIRLTDKTEDGGLFGFRFD